MMEQKRIETKVSASARRASFSWASPNAPLRAPYMHQLGGIRTAIEPPSALEEPYSRLKRSSSSR